MKIVKELPEIFDEFGEQRRKAFLEIKQYKEKGMPVVGMYCAYFPPELAIAAGAVPVASLLFFTGNNSGGRAQNAKEHVSTGKV